MNDDDHLRKVRKKMTEDGRMLEIVTYQNLKQRKWDCEISVPFWDVPVKSELPVMSPELTTEEIAKSMSRPQNSEIRECDIIANKFSSNMSKGWWSCLDLHLVIECKRRKDENWVFLREPARNMRHYATRGDFGYRNLFPGDMYSILEFNDDILLETMDEFIKLSSVGHHTFSHLKSVSHLGYTVFGNYRGNNVREACTQVSNAVDFHYVIQALRTKRVFGSSAGIRAMWQIYPVIIFNGSLIEAVPKDEDIELSRIPWITFYFRRSHRSYLIDIVSYSHLNSYLDLLEEELKRYNDEVSKLDLPNWISGVDAIDVVKSIPLVR